MNNLCKNRLHDMDNTANVIASGTNRGRCRKCLNAKSARHSAKMREALRLVEGIRKGAA